MKSPNACNYLPDRWSFNFCLLFVKRRKKEKTRGWEEEKEETGIKAWNQVREAGERHLTARQLYSEQRVAEHVYSNRKGGDWFDLSNPENEERRWGEVGQGSTGRTPPLEEPLSLSPLLHHSPSLGVQRPLIWTQAAVCLFSTCFRDAAPNTDCTLLWPSHSRAKLVKFNFQLHCLKYIEKCTRYRLKRLKDQ